MNRSLRQLSGWGRGSSEAVQCIRPERISQAQNAGTKSSNIIARGLGRSFGDAALNLDHDVLCTERLNRLLSFDRPNGLLECEAGVSLHEIITFALPKGYFLPVTPSTPHISVGGAIAADVYGCNHLRDGSFSNFVDRIELMCANGRTMICTRERNEDLFWATVGGLGLTGIILRVQLRLLPVETAYLDANYTKISDVDQLFIHLEKCQSNCHYTMAWIDSLAGAKNLGRSLVIQGDHARYEQLNGKARKRPLRPRRRRDLYVPDIWPNWTLNKWSVALLNKMYYWRHLHHARIVKYQRFFYPFAHMQHWNRLYGPRGFLRYQCLIPWEHAATGVQHMFEFIQQKHIPCYWAMLRLCRDDAENGLLSFSKSGISLTLDLPHTDDLIPILHQLNDALINWQGRLSLASDAFMRPSDLQVMYPKLADFKEIKSHIDPQNVFQSSLARRLGIISA